MLSLFLLFTLVPLLELWLLFQLSGLYGFWTTITLVLLTGLAGAALARWQGWMAMSRIQNELRQGMMPTQALGDGVLILVAGVLLITPGVITDVVGLALLIPPVRTGVRKGVQLWIAKNVRLQTHSVWQESTRTNSPNVVEGSVVDDQVIRPNQDGPPEANQPSRW